MKATGVVRRIDDLGRIVIPKEIRRNLRIRDGESLEIFVDGDNIVLKKYSIMKNIDEYASNLVDSLYSLVKKSVVITDCDSVIACSGNVKGLLNKSISDKLSSSIKRRESIIEKYDKELIITDDFSIDSKYVINSIIANGDSVGLVIIFDKDEIGDDDMLIASLASKILSKSIEE
jgi:AbrB family transcriptional regulator (stage V sporulation protein T)